MIQPQRLILFVFIYLLYFFCLIGASMTEWSDAVYLVNNFLCFLFATRVLWRYRPLSKLWLLRLCLLSLSSFGLVVVCAYRLYAPDDTKDAVNLFALVMILLAVVNLFIPVSLFDKEYAAYDYYLTNGADEEGILV